MRGVIVGGSVQCNVVGRQQTSTDFSKVTMYEEAIYECHEHPDNL